MWVSSFGSALVAIGCSHVGLPLTWQAFTSLLIPSLSLVLFLGPCVPREATPPPASPTELSCSWVSVIPVFCAWSFLSYLTNPLFAGDIFSLQRGDKLLEGKGSVFGRLWPHSAHGPQHVMPTCHHPSGLQLSPRSK